jgi:hypothetical protein
MTLYTLDKHTFTRRLLNPSDSQIRELIVEGGNMRFAFVGNDELAMPMFECTYKPVDSEIHGIKWITMNITS